MSKQAKQAKELAAVILFVLCFFLFSVISVFFLSNTGIKIKTAPQHCFYTPENRSREGEWEEGSTGYILSIGALRYIIYNR